MLSHANLDVAADRLWAAERDRRPVPPLTETWEGMAVEDAYAIQQRNIRRWLAGGAGVVGHKVGLTSAVMQAMAGVDEPDYGHLLTHMVVGPGEPLDLGSLIVPRAEPEVAFLLGTDLEGPGVSPEQVLEATAEVAPALEIIDSRIEDWRLTLADTVADNASSARVVLGDTRLVPDALDLGGLRVALRVDGEEVGSGEGSAVLGHPANAVAWLANRLAAFGVGLEAGQIVLPGSLTAAVDLVAGQLVEADFGELGTVAVRCR